MSNSPKKEETKISSTPPTSVKSENRYAILMETNEEEYESWYYFIKYNGNEAELKHLQEQIDSIDWYMLEDISAFTIELDYLVSETTAKEMTKVDMNSHSFHRKFDGKLKRINLRLKPKYSTEKKMSKVYSILGDGRIEDFIDQEDIDPEDMASGSESESESDETSSGESESESDSERSESESDESDGDEKKEKSSSNKKKGKLPAVAKKIDIPRAARFRQMKKKGNKGGKETSEKN